MHHLMVYGSKASLYKELLQKQGWEGPITACHNREEALAAAPDAEIMLGARLPADIYPLMTRCRWVQSFNAGIEDLVAAPLLPGVLATRVVGLFGGYIAEYTLGYMLAHTLRMRQALEQQAAGRWEHYYTGRLSGKRLGLADTGSIGTEVAVRARALGMDVVGLSRSGEPSPLLSAVFTPDRLNQFCAGLDFLAITLPLTPETDGLFDLDALRALNPGALVINAGRGRVVQEEALLAALRSGHLGGVVLDVFAKEPLPPESPLWKEPGVVITPHVSGPSVPAEIVAYFLQNYQRFLKGEPLQGRIHRERGY